MHVTVLYNQQMIAMIPGRGYKSGDEMRAMTYFTVDDTSDLDRLREDVFAAFNQQEHRLVEQVKVPANIRSMSVGDVVVIGEKAWSVEPTGWEALDKPPRIVEPLV